jgi:hypothetical protein
MLGRNDLDVEGDAMTTTTAVVDTDVSPTSRLGDSVDR